MTPKGGEIVTRRAFTTVLDLLGLGLLVACAYFVWPPAALGVAGLGLLAVSYFITTGST